MASTKRKNSRKESPELQDLLVLELQEIHSAESQLSRILPRVMKSIAAEKLQPAVEERIAEGEQVIKDVEAALEELDESPGRKKNVAAEGLVNDIREHIQEIEQGPALDTVLVAALQKAEHYCIAAWGTVRAMGKAVGQKDLVRAMDRALKEGKAYDQQLTEMTEREVTPALMAQAAEQEEREESAADGRSGARRGRDGRASA